MNVPLTEHRGPMMQTTTAESAAGVGAASTRATKTIKQQKLGKHLTFEFDVDKLTYTDRDYSGEKRFSIGYDAIDVLDPTSLAVNHAKRFWNMLRFPVVVCLLLAVVAFSSNTRISWIIALIFLALMAIGVAANHFQLLTIRYTILRPLPGAIRGPIRVIQDKNHATILQEIQARWKERMRRLHRDINFSNDPDKEISKFSWMRDKAIISEEEYLSAVAKLQIYTPSNQPASANQMLN